MRVHYSRPVAGLSAIWSQTFQELFGEYEGRLLRTGYHHQVARLHLQSIAHFGVWIELEGTLLSVFSTFDQGVFKTFDQADGQGRVTRFTYLS